MIVLALVLAAPASTAVCKAAISATLVWETV
jgi:hypothetical protein